MVMIMATTTMTDRRFRIGSPSGLYLWGSRCKFQPRDQLCWLTFCRSSSVCGPLPLPFTSGLMHYSLIVVLRHDAMQSPTLMSSLGQTVNKYPWRYEIPCPGRLMILEMVPLIRGGKSGFARWPSRLKPSDMVPVVQYRSGGFLCLPGQHVTCQNITITS
jgi:hypothetical protein